MNARAFSRGGVRGLCAADDVTPAVAGHKQNRELGVQTSTQDFRYRMPVVVPLATQIRAASAYAAHLRSLAPVRSAPRPPVDAAALDAAVLSALKTRPAGSWKSHAEISDSLPMALQRSGSNDLRTALVRLMNAGKVAMRDDPRQPRKQYRLAGK